MLCLGIESSCDETALALSRDGVPVASVLSSQAPLHSLFGGVVPELASREHYHYIGALYDELLKRAGINAGDIDVVAVARGPGLLGSLLVGMAFAKALALALDRPLLGINHLHAHLLACGIGQNLEFPAIGLLASGGHTELYLVQSATSFIRLGRTLDDAAGEAFDKTAKFLGLPYPGGALMDTMASRGCADPSLLPRPYLDNDNLDFSFSGLKTAAVGFIRQNLSCGGEKKGLEDFCASFNLAVVKTLAAKVKRAARENPAARQLWLAGGVAANSQLRSEMAGIAQNFGLEFRVPAHKYCCDNADMIAHAGWIFAQSGFFHNLDVETVPRGRPLPDDMRRIADLAP